MQEILFNSRCPLDKLPTGAAAAQTKFMFGIRISEALSPDKLWLAVINDDDNSEEKFPMEAVWNAKNYVRYQLEHVFPKEGLFWYHFELMDTNGKTLVIEKTDCGASITDAEPHPWQLTVYRTDYTTPDWICGGAFYHIFVDRFCSTGSKPTKHGAVLRDDWGGVPEYKPDEHGEILNNDFFGGSLQGVLTKLPYLASLGISCIYLSPIFEAYSNHKYDTGDYLKIDPFFGDDQIFMRLCYEARKLDIRIILDGVFNHTGADSVYFNKYKRYNSQGAFNSQSSPYSPWYSFSQWPEQYAAWWGINTLPQVNEEETTYRDFIMGETGVLQKWMALGASGWRLDVADELTENFICELRRSVKIANADALIIGEVWEDASNKVSYGQRRHYFQGKELDSTMNYPFRTAIIDYIMSTNPQPLAECVETICENYPKPSLDCMMNILGTHDTPRILTVLSGAVCGTRDEKAEFSLDNTAYRLARERLFSASLLQFTLPGVPCIYYGDEAGMEGFEDPFNRRCYPWGQEDTLLQEWYRKLLMLRRDCSIFAGGSYETLSADKGLFVFQRKKLNQRVIIAVNRGCDPASISIESGELLLRHNCKQGQNSVDICSGGCAVLLQA